MSSGKLRAPFAHYCDHIVKVLRKIWIAGSLVHDSRKSAMLLWRIFCVELHHSGVRVVLVMERSHSHVGQDSKVSRAAPHHRPEQFIIPLNQFSLRSKLAAEKRKI